jgi:hypothetical protein
MLETYAEHAGGAKTKASSRVAIADSGQDSAASQGSAGSHAGSAMRKKTRFSDRESNQASSSASTFVSPAEQTLQNTPRQMVQSGWVETVVPLKIRSVFRVAMKSFHLIQQLTRSATIRLGSMDATLVARQTTGFLVIVLTKMKPGLSRICIVISIVTSLMFEKLTKPVIPKPTIESQTLPLRELLLLALPPTIRPNRWSPTVVTHGRPPECSSHIFRFRFGTLQQLLVPQ